jgi:UDP-N-acetyl-D-mannosaminuronate dehydrogenase
VLDIKLIREKPDFVRQRLATRGTRDEARIDELLKLDEQRRKFLAEVESLKSQRNLVSKEIGALIRLGREINDEMPKHVIELLTQTLASNGKALSRAKVGILGVTYKADVDDLTNTPTKIIIEELLKKGASVTVYDPHSPETFQGKRASSIQESVKDSNAVIITVPHKEFKSIDPADLKKLTRAKCVIFDAPRICVPSEISSRGLIYISLGKTALKGVRK